jgi:hypothetical protein
MNHSISHEKAASGREAASRAFLSEVDTGSREENAPDGNQSFGSDLIRTEALIGKFRTRS